MLAWESEAHFLVQEKGADHLEIVVPSISILAEHPISMAADGKGGTRDASAAYTEYLYTYHAQEIAAKHYYRPRNPLRSGNVQRAVPLNKSVHRRRGVRRLA